MLSGVIGFASPRVENFASAVTSVGTLAGETFSLLVYTSFDLVSLGQNNEFQKNAVRFQRKVGLSVGRVSTAMIKIINPNAEFIPWKVKGSAYEVVHPLSKGRIRFAKLPEQLWEMAAKQQEIIDRLYLNGNWLERQIETRLIGLVSGLALAIAGVALTVFGGACTVVAMMSFGYFETVNSYAINNIEAIGFAINQLQQAVLGVILPHYIASAEKHPSKANFALYRGAAWVATGAAGIAAYRWTRA